VAGVAQNGFRSGMLAAVIFPILLLLGLLLLGKDKSPSNELKR
jgi:hypothetical protein